MYTSPDILPINTVALKTITSSTVTSNKRHLLLVHHYYSQILGRTSSRSNTHLSSSLNPCSPTVSCINNHVQLQCQLFRCLIVQRRVQLQPNDEQIAICYYNNREMTSKCIPIFSKNSCQGKTNSPE